MDSELEEIRKKKIEELKARAKSRVEEKQKEIKPDPKVIRSTSPTHLDSNTFDEFIQEKPIAFIDFWAEWCGPCKMVSPILDKLAKKYSGKVWIGKVNVDHNQNLAMKYGATSIPTFWAFKKGEAVKRMVGAQPKASFEKLFNEVINMETE